MTEQSRGKRTKKNKHRGAGKKEQSRCYDEKTRGKTKQKISRRGWSVSRARFELAETLEGLCLSPLKSGPKKLGLIASLRRADTSSPATEIAK